MVVRVVCNGRNRNAVSPRWNLAGIFRFSSDVAQTQIINTVVAMCRIFLQCQTFCHLLKEYAVETSRILVRCRSTRGLRSW